MAAPLVTLNNGVKCPIFGLGTVRAADPELFTYAVSVGYRHFDTAWAYGNEKEVGAGLRAAIDQKLVKREDLFVVTKLWNTFHEREQVVPMCKESLKNLGFDYVDLYLVHWPVAQKKSDSYDETDPLKFSNFVAYEHDFRETWKGMEECYNLGLTKSIGLSNFNEEQIDKILSIATVKPVMNQIKVNPLQNQKKLIDFIKSRNMEVTAYSPLTAPGAFWRGKDTPPLDFNDPRLVKIGKKYGKTGTQVIFRYLIDIGAIPIPMSSNKDRIKQNIEIFDFKLAPEDIAVVDTFNVYESGIDLYIV